MSNINRLAVFASAVMAIIPGVFAQTGGLAQVSGGITEEEKAYQRRWSAEEIGAEWLQMEEWIKGEAGRGKGVMPPWTPMEVKGQEVHCWGRIYRYNNTLFPAQVTSLGEDHFSEAPYFLLRQGNKTHKFQDASVEIERVSDELVRVKTESTSGPFVLRLEKEYEFDGMAKVKFSLCANGPVAIDRLELVLPMNGTKSKMFHYIVTTGEGFNGGYPNTDVGAVAQEGFVLDNFRTMIWLGDMRSGFCWFAENMENWRIGDEKAIQALEPEKNGARLLRIKLGDKQFVLKDEWKMVFGMQATPTRPRKADFRRQSDWSTFKFSWNEGEGEYYPFYTDVANARQYIEKERAQGREVMPNSSLTYYGIYRFYKNMFGKVANPGLMHRELMLWGPLWTRDPVDGIRYFENCPCYGDKTDVLSGQHTAKSKWCKRGQPMCLARLCANSTYQDYYIWRLEKLVKETGLKALYLDQGVSGCANKYHGCGYINYKGKWAATANIFAMREMAKRVRRVFCNAHGDSKILWHMSGQLFVPVISMGADTFLDGENYRGGPLMVREFYSKLLTEDRMKGEHTGIQFGFVPLFYPEFTSVLSFTKELYAPTPASTRDMLGLMFVHDSNVAPQESVHNSLTIFMQEKRLSYFPDCLKVSYYCEDNGLVKATPGNIKHILHYGADKGLLILFNWSDEVAMAELSLNTRELFKTGTDLPLTDAINGEQFSLASGSYNVPIAPRDLRMLEIKK